VKVAFYYKGLFPFKIKERIKLKAKQPCVMYGMLPKRNMFSMLDKTEKRNISLILKRKRFARRRDEK